MQVFLHLHASCEQIRYVHHVCDPLTKHAEPTAIRFIVEGELRPHGARIRPNASVECGESGGIEWLSILIGEAGATQV